MLQLKGQARQQILISNLKIQTIKQGDMGQGTGGLCLEEK